VFEGRRFDVFVVAICGALLLHIATASQFPRLGEMLSLATLLVVAWQAYETGQAVKASQASIQTIERHFKMVHYQWLRTTNWRMSQLLTEPSGRPYLEIRFALENPTEMPVTVTSWNAQLAQRSSGGATASPVQLGPKSTATVGFASYQLENDEMSKWRAGRLWIPASCEVHYDDAFGEHRVQWFHKVCIGGEGIEAHFSPHDIGLRVDTVFGATDPTAT
jgi:hypothetical protein